MKFSKQVRKEEVTLRASRFSCISRLFFRSVKFNTFVKEKSNVENSDSYYARL